MRLALLLAIALLPIAPEARAVCDVGLAFPDTSSASLDADGDGLWSPPGDRVARVAVFAGPGEPIVGDWNGDGVDELAKLVLVPDGGGSGPDRPYFYVDANGSGDWEGTAGGDAWANWIGSMTSGSAVEAIVPLAWRMTAGSVTAYFQPEGQRFAIDLNGNRTWEGSAGGDYGHGFANFASSQGPAVPVVGDWNGDGDDDAGIAIGTRFYLDRNGNRSWSGNAGGDRNTSFAAAFAGQPIVGDWDGNGDDEIGAFVPPGTFLLDANDDGIWSGPIGGDVRVAFGGADPESTPLVCDWNGDGADDVGVATSARVFAIDLDGDRVFDAGDRSLAFEPPDADPARPIAGSWSP